MKQTVLLVSTLLLLAAGAPDLQVAGPWVRESNPATRITAVYLTLTNPTPHAITVVGASSPAAKVVEMHEMTTVDGVMTMRQTSKIVIPARGTVKLQPGGMHLMLIDLVEPLRAGASVDLTLKLEDGSPVVVHAPVKNPDAE